MEQPPTLEPTPKRTLKGRLTALFVEYGPVAIGVWFVLFALIFAGAFVAFHFGVRADSAAGNAGAIAGAYVVTQLAKPIRFGATLLLTPVVARLLNRLRGRATPEKTPVK